MANGNKGNNGKGNATATGIDFNTLASVKKDVRIRKDKNAKSATKFELELTWHGFTEKELIEWATKGLIIRYQEILRKTKSEDFIKSLSGKTLTVTAREIADTKVVSADTAENKAAVKTLKALLDKGIITQDQFEAQVAEIYGAIEANS